MSRRKDPIDTIVWTPAEELHPNDWNPNRVLTAELVLLERSLLSTGWIQPVLAASDSQEITMPCGESRVPLTSCPPVIRAA